MTHVWLIRFEGMDCGRDFLMEYCREWQEDDGFYSLDKERVEKSWAEVPEDKKEDHRFDYEELLSVIEIEGGSIDVQID
jgi:hypothetical protein